MALFSAKRGNPFAARSRQRQAALQAKLAPPTPAEPEPEPEPSQPSALADACTCGPGGGCDRDDCAGTPLSMPVEIDGDSATEPLPDAIDGDSAERETLADESPKSDTVPNVASEQIDEPKRGRGRPRPMATVVRDGKVYDLLQRNGGVGISKADIAATLDEKEQQVYSSLRQLSKEGRAETRYVKDDGYRWFAVTGTESE